MMNRRLLRLNLTLFAALGVVWGADTWLRHRETKSRRFHSVLHALTTRTELERDAITALELTMPGAEGTWRYVRGEPGWRIPGYRDAFARTGDLDGLLQTLLRARGSRVGRVSDRSHHFGVAPAETMNVRAFVGDALVLSVRVGKIAPGQRARECYMTIADGGWIYHMDSNPWPYLTWRPGNATPPLFDAKVIPEALGRHAVMKIAIAGSRELPFKELLCERLEDPEKLRDPRAGPTIEWYGILASGERRRIADAPAMAYANRLRTLTFDALVEPGSTPTGVFEAPALTLTLEYQDGATDLLSLTDEDRDARDLGGVEISGPLLRNHTTGAVFVIRREKAAALLPDASLLEALK